MLMTKMTISNFRQYYENTQIEFATDKEKNVTFIIGRGGAGKTTLSQAIQWCLYGETDFTVKTILSAKKNQELKINDKATAYVSIDLNHKGKEFIISRSQIFTKFSNETKFSKSTIEITEIDNKGKQRKYTEEEASQVVNNILPKKLARYFLFDGEKIENMRSEINSKKVTEFKKAVEKLLGLEALKNLIEHFKPTDGTTGRSVAVTFNNLMLKSGSEKVNEVNRKLADFSNTESQKKIENQELIDENIRLNSLISEMDKVLVEENKSKSIQTQINQISKEMETKKKETESQEEKISDSFNSNGIIDNYVSFHPIGAILKDIENFDIKEAGIPSITSETISYILKNETCICGNHINDKEKKKLNKIFDLLPPQSISTYLSSYIKDCRKKLNNSGAYYEKLDGEIRKYKNMKDEMKVLEDNFNTLTEQIRNLDNEKIRKASDLKENTLKSIKENETKINENNGEIRYLSGEIIKLKTEQSNLKGQSKIYEVNKLYKEIVSDVYTIIKGVYDSEERKTIIKLNETINSKFKLIYGKGSKIEINNDYGIEMSVEEITDESENKLQASQSKFYALIFAFIISLIELAGLKRESNNIQLDSGTDEYPMIMDAPLSAFDKDRIKQISNLLPKSARQVMMFIKDTDGDEARNYLKKNIGAEYTISMNINEDGTLSQVHSKIERV